VYVLITVAAVAVLIAVLLLPVLQITGNSMTDTLQDGDVVVALKGGNYQVGDVVAFYYNNSILVKRVIATAGDWVDIDQEGNVSVNNVPLEEPYVSGKTLGDCNIELPYQVPDGKCFLMGDHRSTSVDSRNATVGSISKDNIIGKLIFRVWPLSGLGPIH
jgi:signal peptidase I